jgi:homoserine O-acetyltransferase/O-succinyltransferase
MRVFLNLFLVIFIIVFQVSALAQKFLNQKYDVWTAKDFRFHTGEVMPLLNIGYTTLGNPSGEVIVILHGTAGTGAGMLNSAFGGELFGLGQPLDAAKYFIVLPDSIGTGKSSKPSDGLRAEFPKYNYDDAVLAQYRLLTEKLNLKHVRLILGNSMGGMQTWLWGIKYPNFMDILVPMASMPSEMSGRNWMMRRLIIDSIRNDPEWMNGNYVQQPRSLKFASLFFAIGTNGGNQGLQRLAPTRAKADQLLNERFSTPFVGDANDHLYQWDSSRDYNPLDQIDKIKATLLAINSADDERNPPELGVMQKALSRIPNARLLLIPASDQTSGHGTTGQAKWWKQEVGELVRSAPYLKNF